MKMINSIALQEMQGFDIDFFKEIYIDPIEKMGLRNLGYSNILEKTNNVGTHTLIFKKANIDFKTKREVIKYFFNIDSDREEGQPFIQVSFSTKYCFVFIPYTLPK